MFKKKLKKFDDVNNAMTEEIRRMHQEARDRQYEMEDQQRRARREYERHREFMQGAQYGPPDAKTLIDFANAIGHHVDDAMVKAILDVPPPKPEPEKNRLTPEIGAAYIGEGTEGEVVFRLVDEYKGKFLIKQLSGQHITQMPESISKKDFSELSIRLWGSAAPLQAGYDLGQEYFDKYAPDWAI